MKNLKDFFSKIDEFICPELFNVHLEGFEDLVKLWDILQRIQNGFTGVALQKLKPQILGTIEEGAFVKGDVYLGKGAVIEAGAMVCGPTIIDDYAEVRHGAFVRGNVIIGAHGVVGHASEVVRSILLPHAKAPHFNYVGDSVLGSNVNLGAGTKLSNLKNDGTGVKTRVGMNIIDTGIRKFGAILGDNCKLGCNSVTNPGTIMEPNCAVYPCASVSGYYDENSVIKLKQTFRTISER
ncbi:MAG: Bifunctional protein GlmU [bacterium ADurb.Bin157]|nr:MAG: Bifunctional protein GlmU [bacterium ADurb.Bin157]